ncbi:hypothetical protein [Agrobacterium sp. LMR679]|uniref:hypothetical protein n=1 Tax=Agrobacterium sp. LMR679 TaxID=3014335 RepID=UPI0022B0362C|nr:hypothetical protein [Agrobacterium sp. LMR679]MCZ4073537.1 hypothetical protein [Agrobacterium sp. LMR679]
MAENPYPIPRQLRLSDILVGDGGDTYGPFDFEIFDTQDAVVCVRPAGALRFEEVPDVVVTKVNGNTVLNPFDAFTIKFPYLVPETTRFVVLSARVAARDAGVISGTKINPDALEKEFSKIATQQQELRRDIGRAIVTDFGAPSFTLDADMDDGRTLMKQGNRLVAGPDLGAIGDEVEAMKDLVEGWASDIVSQGNVPIYAAVVGMPALEIPAGINAIRVNGFYVAGDGGGALYVKAGGEPAHDGKFQTADGAWWEIAETFPNPLMFGAVGDGVADDRAAILRAKAFAGGRPIVLPAGTYEIGSALAFAATDRLVFEQGASFSGTQPTGGLRVFDYYRSAPVAGSKMKIEKLFEQADSHKLEDIAGIWPGQVGTFFGVSREFGPGYVSGTHSPANAMFAYAANTGSTADVVASMSVAFSWQNSTTSFGANIIAGSAPGVNGAKLVGVEIDVEPSAARVAGRLVRRVFTSMPSMLPSPVRLCRSGMLVAEISTTASYWTVLQAQGSPPDPAAS